MPYSKKSLEFKVCLFLVFFIFSCTNTQKQNAHNSSNQTVPDSTQKNIYDNQNIFKGEYLVGDGSMFIVPAEDIYELCNEKLEKRDVLYFQGKEKDTISVYANKGNSIIFKMNPGHKFGMYYENDEQWPVSYLKPIPGEESEKEESEQIFKQRHIEDSIAYTQLGIYNGNYWIKTESEGVNATLTLNYNGDKTFNYEWQFVVDNEEIKCFGKKKGVLAMDRTQHGVDLSGNCTLHFNFNGFWNDGYIVEIDFEDQAKCPDLKGECTFSGTYIKNKVE